VPDAYVDAVLASGAVHYWRFEEENDRQVADLAGDAVAVLNGGVRIENGLRSPGKHQAPHGFAFVAEPDPSLLNNEFTLEAWVKPSFVQKRTVISIAHRDHDPEIRFRKHLCAVALVPSEQQTVYPGETFRFTANLWPYGEEQAVVSAFSADRYRPLSWHHVVAVRHRNQIEIYMNGRATQTVPAPSLTSDSLPSTITIGAGPRALGALSDRGFFKGLVDEIAVYPSALSAQEVAKHHQLMQAP
jgi:hypothetical protein